MHLLYFCKVEYAVTTFAELTPHPFRKISITKNWERVALLTAPLSFIITRASDKFYYSSTLRKEICE